MSAKVQKMSIAIKNLRLDLEHAKSYDGIRFIPVVATQPSSDIPVHRFLWEAMEDKSITVEELPNSSVPTVTLNNTATESFLSYRGTIIRGGGQNRQIVHSLIIPENQAIKIPVQCIQQGRWNPHRQQEFTSQRGEVTSSNMRFKAKSQHDTWSSITTDSDITRTMSTSSDFTVSKDYYLGSEHESNIASQHITSNSVAEQRMRQHGRDKAQTMLHELETPVANQVGMYVIMIDAELFRQRQQTKIMYCLEAFASPELYSKIHKEVVSSFIADMAMIQRDIPVQIPEPNQEQFERFIAQIQQAPWQKKDSIGKEVRQELPQSENMFGESISFNDQLLHVMCSSQENR